MVKDDVAEELGEHALPPVADVGGDLIGDGGLHIVAGEGQAAARLAQDALNGGKGALLGHRPSGNIQPLKQLTFFTGKSHGSFLSCLIKIDISIYQ